MHQLTPTGGVSGMLRGGLSLGLVGLAIGGIAELVKFGAALDPSNQTSHDS